MILNAPVHCNLLICQNADMTSDPTAPVESSAAVLQVSSAPKQARNPLHGLTLEAIVTELHAHYDWPGLAQRIPVRCFQSDPSVASSLKFLRKTPWAREKVESLYLFMLREKKRQEPAAKQPRKYG
jgi:uncharacterized protein (DUF2132 family)